MDIQEAIGRDEPFRIKGPGDAVMYVHARMALGDLPVDVPFLATIVLAPDRVRVAAFFALTPKDEGAEHDLDSLYNDTWMTVRDVSQKSVGFGGIAFVRYRPTVNGGRPDEKDIDLHERMRNGASAFGVELLDTILIGHPAKSPRVYSMRQDRELVGHPEN